MMKMLLAIMFASRTRAQNGLVITIFSKKRDLSSSLHKLHQAATPEAKQKEKEAADFVSRFNMLCKKKHCFFLMFNSPANLLFSDNTNNQHHIFF